MRTTFVRWKADDLDATGLADPHRRVCANLGGLLKHLALTEDYIFTRKLSGEPVGEPWESLWGGTDLVHEHPLVARSRPRHHRDITGHPLVTWSRPHSRHADVKVG